jgi:transcriptional regulator with XRE-family HTH domain
MNFRKRRLDYRIPGAVVAMRAGISQGRLSNIERGYCTPKPEEVAALNATLDDLVAKKAKLAEFALQIGYPISEAL